MTAFDDRKASFEAKFHHDEELRFRVNARRAHLLADWAAAERGLTGAEKDAYVARLGEVAFQHPNDSALIDAIETDFAAHKVDVSRHRIEKQLDDATIQAQEQLGVGVPGEKA